ncbi:hypothetical protein ACH42_08085 [Endozoicomonas sp. (ex Bugula neritina AB1)]|nr:hypothetical protein ACH42_08085 [Endozoicomonas sp. (ex Bugula neritina AB1)]
MGWGQKGNTQKARQYAQQHQMPFWNLEDGFISYLGHPVLGDKRFSLIVDKTGIYYDATQTSDIEKLLNDPVWLTPELQHRSARLLETICKHQISKYNHEPVGWADQANLREQKRVLVVDQTYGDCSVRCGMADDASFTAMLEAALDENPDSDVWVKVHPDVVLGKKEGYFSLEACGTKVVGFDNPRVKVLADKVNAQSLFPSFDKVYVVTSQLGFEALWHRKPVVCFGVPFYSGWGLTDDRVSCPRRVQKHSIESLFAAACLKYTRYIDPETGERGELEDVIELVALQRHYQQQEVDTLYAVGFSLWKRAFMADFIGYNAGKVCFVKSVDAAYRRAGRGDGILVWGAKNSDFIPPSGVSLWRCEDAFIRSNGLGAELRRPGSLVLDKQGMYFDCTKPSDLEEAINTIELTEVELQRAADLRQLLIEQRVSKYNLKGQSQPIFIDAASGQQRILITGQVDNDASLKWGSPVIRSNLELLKAVRKFAPEAYIAYKPHPDVLMAGRAGYVPDSEALQWVNRIVTDGDIYDCIDQCDELHVMTSLAGFEALVWGKVVHCWGMPFYAGWQLTGDHMSCERRKAVRSIEELIFFAHHYYPRYINWVTRRFTTPERLIVSLKTRQQVDQKSRGMLFGWFSRTQRKIKYLLEAFIR